MRRVFLFFLLYTAVACGGLAAGDASPVPCDDRAPPCGEDCYAMPGWLVEGGCRSAEMVDLGCTESGYANALSSCVMNMETGASYLLPSDTYRQRLTEKPEWDDCRIDWSHIPPCE